MSRARRDTFKPLIQDVDELMRAHQSSRTGAQGRQWGLGGLNRAAVALVSSAWEAYIEDLALECATILRPPSFEGTWRTTGAAWPYDAWPATMARVQTERGRFNTPSPDNVKRLLQVAIGIADVTQGWFYRGCSQPVAVSKMEDLLRLRHRIVHGENPRPSVHNKYAAWAPLFVSRIVERTDDTVLTHLTGVLQVQPSDW